MAIDISDSSAPGQASSFDASRFIPPRTECLAAFIGRANRGPLNEPVVIASFDAYRRTFGGHGQLGFLSVAVQQYFEHGGAVAVVVRVANNATRARVDLPAQSQLLRLHAREPGSRFVLRASVDYDGVKSNEERFNLVVQRLARPGSQLVEDQELFRGLSMDESDGRSIRRRCPALIRARAARRAASGSSAGGNSRRAPGTAATVYRDELPR
jgi:hypothetical protein